jgi:hypothetical protein
MTRSPTGEDVLQAVRDDDLRDVVLLQLQHGFSSRSVAMTEGWRSARLG